MLCARRLRLRGRTDGLRGFGAARTRLKPSLKRSIVPSGLSAGTSGGGDCVGFFIRTSLVRVYRALPE